MTFLWNIKKWIRIDKSETRTLGNTWKQNHHKQKVDQIEDKVVWACIMHGQQYDYFISFKTQAAEEITVGDGEMKRGRINKTD
jgi:hypothetical protein